MSEKDAITKAEAMQEAAEEEARKTAENDEATDEFARLLEEAAAPPSFRRGDLVEAEIVGVDRREVLVDIGGKSEAVIPREEFAEAGLDAPRPGARVAAVVVRAGAGGLRLSVLEAARRQAWDTVQRAVKEDAPVRVQIQAQIKGGFAGRIGPLRAFLPWSEADVRPPRPSELVGHEVDALVVETDARAHSVVVSRKRLMEREVEAARARFFAEAQEGMTIKGRVRRIADFGAFVEVAPHVEALLPASEITHRRIVHPREVLRRGQEVEAVILALKPEEGRITLSTKALEPDPWEGVAERFPSGARVQGRVVKILPEGAIVELAPGLDGFLHRSELSWARRQVRPSEVLAEGDEVEVQVLEVDAEARRIRLSLKAVQPNPWEMWLAEHPVGSRVKGPVRTKTDFGVFVRVGEELDGLVHLNDLSWTEEPEEVLARIEVGQELECVVLGVDVARERISLGIKQLEEDPFLVFLKGAPKGGAVKGTVREVREDGLVVDLAPGVAGFVPRREIPRGREYAAGDEVEARLIEADRRRRRVVLSIRRHEQQLTREAMRKLEKESAKALPSPLALELQKALGKHGGNHA